MPEGPEIKRAADRLAKVLEGRLVRDVTADHVAVQPHLELMRDARIERVYARSKAMLIQFDSGITMYSHNQLYGVWRVNRLSTAPLATRRLRVEFKTNLHAVRLYSATDISVWENDLVQTHPYLLRLGPDVLDALTDADLLLARLEDPRFSRRSLAALYLDQSFIAGIGNYLRSEILFTAGCHPMQKPGQLNRRQRRKLARETLKISQRSYVTGGVTNLDSRVRKLEREGARFERYRFFVFGRDGEPCYQCGDEIIREERSARRIYWCPTCQTS